MSVRQRHVIKRQIIELSVPDQQSAQAIQNEISKLFHQKLCPLIDASCSELTESNAIHRIETLEIDLGEIPADGSEDILCRRFKERFHAALSEALDTESANHLTPSQERKSGTQLELFSHFLNTGTLPWWADHSRPGILDETVTWLIHNTPQAIEKLLTRIISEERSTIRLILSLDETNLASLAGLVAQRPPEWISTLHNNLTTIIQGTKDLEIYPSEEHPTVLWRILFQSTQFVRTKRKQNLTTFVEAILRSVQTKTKLPRRTVIAKLLESTRGFSTPQLPLREDLIQIFETLQREDEPGSLQISPSLKPKSNLRPTTQESHPLKKDLANDSLSSNFPAPNTSLPPPISTEPVTTPPPHIDPGDPLSSVLSQSGSDKNPPLSPSLKPSSNLRPTTQESHPLEKDPAKNPLSPTVPSPNTSLPPPLSSTEPEPSAPPHIDPGDPLSSASSRSGTDDLSNLFNLSFNDTDELYPANAGLVLLAPFLEIFFDQLGLLEDRSFKNSAARNRAAGLLQFLADGQTGIPLEYSLPLNKILVGMDLAEVFEFGLPLTAPEKEAGENLLNAAIAAAPGLGEISIPGLRGTFLLRQGQLSSRDGLWLLRVESKTFDIILERLPWSFSIIKLPWMETPIQIEW